MQASDHLIAFLKEQEGFEPNLYCDAAGHCTIGYGHLVHLGKPGDNPRREAIFERGVNEVQATALLVNDMRKAEWAIANLVSAPLTQGQYDALTSLLFNIGTPAFEESTLRRVLNDRHYDAIPALWRQWNHVHREVSEGLTTRREAELVMWGAV